MFTVGCRCLRRISTRLARGGATGTLIVLSDTILILTADATLDTHSGRSNANRPNPHLRNSCHVIRILIVDDHPVFRAGLSNLLESEPDFIVIGKAGNGQTALALWQQHTPHILLLDLRLSGISGFETLRRIRAIQPDAKAIILTSSESADDSSRAMQAGAWGYLTKHIDQKEIIAAIRNVHRGERFFQKSLVTSPVSSGMVGPGGLSTREIDVLTCLRRGFSNAEIGNTLGITERTAKAHVSAIFKKLHAADRAEAVGIGFDLGILKTSANRIADLS